MSDKVQKIRQEIERLKTQNETYLDKEYTESTKWYKHGAYDICNSILSLIDSLPEEPTSKDLEEAAEMFYDNCDISKSSWWNEGVLYKMSESKETFIAGAKWQKQQMMKNVVDAIVHQGLYSKYVKECDDEALANVLKNYNSGDRVKIIIIKTE